MAPSRTKSAPGKPARSKKAVVSGARKSAARAVSRVAGLSRNVATIAGASKLVPLAARIVVQYTRNSDPTKKQTAAVHSLVKKFANKARVAGEFPGAVKVEIHSKSEKQFRREVSVLGGWKVSKEGIASMPPPPLPEESDDDK